MSVITYNLLNKFTEIAHFCTTRHGGASMGNYASFNLSPFSGDNPISINDNTQRLCKKLNIEPEQLIFPYQTHGDEIREIDEHFLKLLPHEKTAYLYGVDALYTQLSEICIGITTADCVPLLFFDPVQKVIAAAHAGWRGTCAGIAAKTVCTLSEKYHCKPADIHVSIGPSISGEVYEVGKEVADCFESAGFETEQIVSKRHGALYLDLWKANKLQLEQLGILTEHIEVAEICTYTEHERFFSARRLGIKSGRMLSGIKLISGQNN